MRSKMLLSGPIAKKMLKEPDFEQPFFEVEVAGKMLRYANTNRLSAKRVGSLMTKEPTTMTWLENFGKDEIFLDVGANVGMYTVYAAVMSGCRVYAFEPDSLNYAELNKNLYLNSLTGQALAYCCAMSDRAAFDVLYRSAFISGYSHHDFGENRWEGPVVNLAASPEARPKQGCIGLSLDIFCQERKIRPSHIKIDVDGLEPKVLKGAEWILSDRPAEGPKLKTILVETDFTLPRSLDMIKFMENRGWLWSWEQVSVNREEVMSKETLEERMKAHKGGANIIYFRDPAYREMFAEFRKNWVPQG